MGMKHSLNRFKKNPQSEQPPSPPVAFSCALRHVGWAKTEQVPAAHRRRAWALGHRGSPAADRSAAALPGTTPGIAESQILFSGSWWFGLVWVGGLGWGFGLVVFLIISLPQTLHARAIIPFSCLHHPNSRQDTIKQGNGPSCLSCHPCLLAIGGSQGQSSDKQTRVT